MSLKPATTVIPAEGAYRYNVAQVEPKRDGMGAEAPQKTSPEGVPVWTVDALRSGAEATDLISVSVPAREKPTVFGEARFQNLRAGLWLGEKGRQGGLYWQAEAVVPAGQPQPKRD